MSKNKGSGNLKKCDEKWLDDELAGAELFSRRYRDEDLEQCRKLARAVLLLAAKQVQGQDAKAQKSAAEYLTSRHEDLLWWCELAEWDVRYFEGFVARTLGAVH